MSLDGAADSAPNYAFDTIDVTPTVYRMRRSTYNPKGEDDMPPQKNRWYKEGIWHVVCVKCVAVSWGIVL